MAHYGEYYETKSKIACDNVFLLFLPTRLSSLELSFLWVAGFKPSLVFRLVTDSVLDLTKKQARRMQVIVVETKGKEKELAKKLARIQENVVGGFGPDQGTSTENASDCSGERGKKKNWPKRWHGFRGMWRCHHDGVGEVGGDRGGLAVERLRLAMEELVGNADMLRSKTVGKVMEILSSAQAVKLFAAAQLQLRIRVLGFQRDADQGGEFNL